MHDGGEVIGVVGGDQPGIEEFLAGSIVGATGVTAFEDSAFRAIGPPDTLVILTAPHVDHAALGEVAVQLGLETFGGSEVNGPFAFEDSGGNTGYGFPSPGGSGKGDEAFVGFKSGLDGRPLTRTPGFELGGESE